MTEHRTAQVLAAKRLVGVEEVQGALGRQQLVQPVEVLPCRGNVEAGGEIPKIALESVSNLEESREADPVGAVLVFLNLLEADADGFGELKLRPPELASAITDPMPDGDIKILRAP